MFKKIILFLVFTNFANLSFAQPVFSDKNFADYIHEKAKPIKDIQFTDENNTIHSLNDHLGKVVLLNFWATWCEPCVHEMPSISTLQDSMQGLNVKIIPLSIDYKGMEAVKHFYKEVSIDNLGLYLDKNGDGFNALELVALPTTIIIDKKGDEVFRVVGDFDWSKKVVKDYLIKLSSD